jgi:hypothetical protein
MIRHTVRCPCLPLPRLARDNAEVDVERTVLHHSYQIAISLTEKVTKYGIYKRIFLIWISRRHIGCTYEQFVCDFEVFRVWVHWYLVEESKVDAAAAFEIVFLLWLVEVVMSSGAKKGLLC